MSDDGNSAQEAVRKTAMTFESRLGSRRKNFNFLQSNMHLGIVLLTCCHGLISKLTSSASVIVVEGVSITPKSLSFKCGQAGWSGIENYFLSSETFFSISKRQALNCNFN